MKYILPILLFTLCAAGQDLSQNLQILIDHSDTIDLAPRADALKQKTREFLRLARNEIFARKGFVFSDPVLQRYFEHTGWYQPQPGESLSFSEIEQKNLGLLKSLEESRPFALTKVLNMYDFNGYLLVYLASGTNAGNYYSAGDTIQQWPTGKLMLLPSGFADIVHLNGLPGEFVEKHALTGLQADDAGSALEAQQISIEDFDGAVTTGKDLEIVLSLQGASDDYSVQVVKLDRQDEAHPVLERILSIPSDSLTKTAIAPDKLLLTADVRKDYQGTSFYEQDYIYDSANRSLYTVPPVFEKPLQGPFEYTGDDIPVYYDAISAAKGQHRASLFMLETGKMVQFVNLFTAIDDGAAQIKFDDKTGWISLKAVEPGSFAGFSAAD